MVATNRLPWSGEEWAAFCLRHGIRKLSLFGSLLHGRDRPDSDVDLLAEFEPGTQIGYLGLARIENELSDRLGRAIDLRTPSELSWYFRDRVLAEAETLYERG